MKKGLAGEPEFAQPPAIDALEAGDFPGQEGEWWELSVTTETTEPAGPISGCEHCARDR